MSEYIKTNYFKQQNTTNNNLQQQQQKFPLAGPLNYNNNIAFTGTHKFNPLTQHVYDLLFRRNFGFQILHQLTHNYQTHFTLRLINNKNKLLQTSVKYDMYNSTILLGNEIAIQSTQKYIRSGQQQQ
eukprot:UN02169